MTQPPLDLWGTAHATREQARQDALARRQAAYDALDEAFVRAGNDGLTADQACQRAHLDLLYGRPRVCEMKSGGRLFESGKRRRYTWPDGRQVRPAAVLCHCRYFVDPVTANLQAGSRA
jgi:hypothetical protein